MADAKYVELVGLAVGGALVALGFALQVGVAIIAGWAILLGALLVLALRAGRR